MKNKQEQVCGDQYMEIMLIDFGKDISLILRNCEISLHTNNSHDLQIVVTTNLFYLSLVSCKRNLLQSYAVHIKDIQGS